MRREPFAILLVVVSFPGCQSRARDAIAEAEFEKSQAIEGARDAALLDGQVDALPGSFYLRYRFTGSSTGAMPQLLMIATDPTAIADDGWARVEATRISQDDRLWKELYVVSDEVAATSTEILKDRGFFGWDSMPNAAKHDGVSWSLAAKTLSGTHASIVSDWREARLYEDFINYQATGKRPEGRDGERVAALVGLVEELRSIAREKGTKVPGPVQPWAGSR